jgi:DNA-binding CsgD family transcriptional regulator
MTGFRVDGQLWAVPIARAAVQGHFTRDEAPRLAALNPHFARMIRLSDRFGLRQAQVQLDTLDSIACAAVLIDWKGTVTRINARAAALIGPDLCIRRGMLRAQDTGSDRELQNLIQQLRSMCLSRGGRPPGRVFIRRDGHAPLVIEALPVAGLAADAFRSARAMLVITDLEGRQAPPEEALRGAFGLTAAEAKLAALLASGETLDAVADKLRIAKETARARLKAVFAKTEVHRQSELVALLARLRGEAR